MPFNIFACNVSPAVSVSCSACVGTRVPTLRVLRTRGSAPVIRRGTITDRCDPKDDTRVDIVGELGDSFGDADHSIRLHSEYTACRRHTELLTLLLTILLCTRYLLIYFTLFIIIYFEQKQRRDERRDGELNSLDREPTEDTRYRLFVPISKPCARTI